VFAKTQTSFQPRDTHHLEDTGLSLSLILDLLLKYTYLEGAMTLAKLMERPSSAPPSSTLMYRHFQKEQLCDTRAMVGDDYEISLSNKGRSMAEVALKKSHYAGPAPCRWRIINSVSLQAPEINLNRGKPPCRAERSGPSAIRDPGTGRGADDGRSSCCTAPTGNGKTSIAERLPGIFGDDLIFVPHAVEVAGQIIAVYDPLIHQTVNSFEYHGDPRWVQCRRPMVKVGGEMRADMLDTRMDEVTRMCTAPLQMKANNGILLIDDFGRQRITPRELLNRWIVPLDRHTDILSLWSGISFEIPFELLVVFATNLPLSDLAEDAFMRRLKNKIKIEPLSQDLFVELLRRVCEDELLPCTPEMEEYISANVWQIAGRAAGVLPTDLMKIIRGSPLRKTHPRE
jgi:hypothetical protein